MHSINIEMVPCLPPSHSTHLARLKAPGSLLFFCGICVSPRCRWRFETCVEGVLCGARGSLCCRTDDGDGDETDSLPFEEALSVCSILGLTTCELIVRCVFMTTRHSQRERGCQDYHCIKAQAAAARETAALESADFKFSYLHSTRLTTEDTHSHWRLDAESSEHSRKERRSIVAANPRLIVGFRKSISAGQSTEVVCVSLTSYAISVVMHIGRAVICEIGDTNSLPRV